MLGTDKQPKLICSQGRLFHVKVVTKSQTVNTPNGQGKLVYTVEKYQEILNLKSVLILSTLLTISVLALILWVTVW